jgi:hypothetical protein
VRPIGGAALDHAGDQRGARRLGELAVERMVEDGVVGVVDRTRQEKLRIGQQRTCLGLEAFRDARDRDLGGHLAMQVAAHAVGDQHQQRVARVAVGDAVLVVAPLAGATFLVDREAHGGVSLNCGR